MKKKQKRRIVIPDFMIILRVMKLEDKPMTGYMIQKKTMFSAAHIYGMLESFIEASLIRNATTEREFILTSKGRTISNLCVNIMKVFNVDDNNMFENRRQRNTKAVSRFPR